MIYLKLFENFDLGFIGRNNSREISDKFRVENAENFTDSEIEQIKTLLKNYGVDKFELKLISVYLKTNHLPSQSEQGGYSAIGAWIPHKDIKSTKKYIRIEKNKDEWFLVTDYPFFYECDQINGVINFLKSILPEKVEEAFKDEYDSKFDPNKYSERDKYWNGYLDKMKSDQDKLKKELEEDPKYFSLVDEDELDILFDRLTDFDDDEIENIKKLFTDKYIIEESKWKKYNSNNTVTFIEATRPKFCQIRIWKLEDEWYIVSTADADGRGIIFDKCDQFEGLKRLLNKTLVK